MPIITSAHPFRVEPHVNERGRAWVEISVTGQGAIDLARGIAGRLAGQGIIGRATEPIVTLIASVIAGAWIEMTAYEADQLGQLISAEAERATSPEYADAVTEGDR